MLLLFFIFVGFKTPLPLPEEQGVEVNLGNSEDGMGDVQPDQLSENNAAMPTEQSSADKEEISSQNTEEAIKLNENKKDKNNTVTKPTEVVKEAIKINPLSIFTGKKDGKNGGNEGNTAKPGDQGNPFGNPNASNHVGTPGNGGGPSFSLKGRSSKSLPKPDYNSKEQGTVVVKIWVNNNGEVSRVEAGQRGTTTSDRTLWKQAENAALRARFSPDANAPEDQTGTITYKFIRLN
jgi:TonB family protein